MNPPSPALSLKETVVERECKVYAEYLNRLFPTGFLRENGYIPLSGQESLVNSVKDGVFIAYLMHSLHPAALDPAQFHPFVMSGAKFNTRSFQTQEEVKPSQTHTRFRMVTNINTLLTKLALPPFKLLSPMNTISAEHVIEGDKNAVLDLIWRFIRALALQNVSLNKHTELILLTDESFKCSDLAQANEEAILLRWLNFHLRRSGSARQVSNFGKDLADASAYIILMSQVAPEQCNEKILQEALNTSLHEREKRCELVLENAKLLGFELGISPIDLAQGHARLGLLFLSFLFNNYIGISHLTSEDELDWLEQELEKTKATLRHTQAKLDELKFKSSEEDEEARQRLITKHTEFKKKALQCELQLSSEIEQLRLELQQKDIIDKEVLSRKFDKYRGLLEQNLGKTLDLLQSYMKQRDEIFKNANQYEIIAFNNEGKKIVFKIPAPSLKQKCSFQYGEMSGKKRGIKPPEPPSKSKEIAIGTDDLQDFINSEAGYELERPLSAPPDTRMDRNSIGSEILLRSTSLQKKIRESMIEVEEPKLSGEVHKLVQALMEENMAQIQQMQLLAAKVDEMSWLNQVMGDKVRAFSEDMINKKTHKKFF